MQQILFLLYFEVGTDTLRFIVNKFQISDIVVNIILNHSSLTLDSFIIISYLNVIFKPLIE